MWFIIQYKDFVPSINLLYREITQQSGFRAGILSSCLVTWIEFVPIISLESHVSLYILKELSWEEQGWFHEQTK